MRRLTVVMASSLLAVTACTGTPQDTGTTSNSPPAASTAAAQPPGGASTGGAPDAQDAVFVPNEAIQVLDNVSSCAQGLQDLADNPYVYPADPAVAAEGGRAWTDVFGEFQSGHLPACQAVGTFIDAHQSDPAMASVAAALAADGRGGWARYFDDGQGVVQQGSRIQTYCPVEHLAQFDCEEALVRIGESTAALQNLLALVASATSPSAAAVTEVAAQQAEPLDVDAGSDVVTVADPDSDLKGMTIAPASGAGTDVAEVTVGTAATENLPGLPDSVTALSDPFAVEGTSGKSVEVRFPVPTGTDVASVRLYELATVPGLANPIWSSIGPQMRYEDSDGVTSVVAPVGEFDGVARWVAVSDPTGTDVDPVPTTQGANWLRPKAAEAVDRPASLRTTTGTPTSGAARADGVSCSPVTPEKERPYAECKSNQSDRQDLAVRIYDWGTVDQRFGGLNKEDVSATIFDTVVWAKGHGLGWNATTTVTIEDLGPDLAGYVNPRTPESAKTIHLTQRDNDGARFMTGTIVHELFHAAQGNPGTAMNGPQSTLLAPTNDKTNLAWLIEGTADWSIDQVYDDKNLLDSYGNRILEVGLNAKSSDDGDSPAYPYERASFFKLLNSACPGFDTDLRPIFNANRTEDVTALKNLTTVLAGLPCDFGSQLGPDEKSNLVSALVYYNWATQSEADLSLLDSNESANGVPFKKPAGKATVSFASVAEWPTGKQSRFAPFALDSASAQSFVLPSVSGPLPDDKVAELTVSVSNPSPASATTQPIVVSLTSKDAAFKGTTTIGPSKVSSDWFSAPMASAPTAPTNSSTASPPPSASASAAPAAPANNWQSTSYVYRAGQSVPEMFLTVANPNIDPGSYVGVRVSFTIRDRVPDDPPAAG